MLLFWLCKVRRTRFMTRVQVVLLVHRCSSPLTRYLWGRGSWLRWRSGWPTLSPPWACACWKRPAWWPRYATGCRSAGCRCSPSTDSARSPGRTRSGWSWAERERKHIGGTRQSLSVHNLHVCGGGASVFIFPGWLTLMGKNYPQSAHAALS